MISCLRKCCPQGLRSSRGSAVAAVLLAVALAGASGATCVSEADFDGNGAVDFDDFFLFADHFRTEPGGPGWDPALDLDGDLDVDFDDFLRFADDWGVCEGDGG